MSYGSGDSVRFFIRFLALQRAGKAPLRPTSIAERGKDLQRRAKSGESKTGPSETGLQTCHQTHHDAILTPGTPATKQAFRAYGLT